MGKLGGQGSPDTGNLRLDKRTGKLYWKGPVKFHPEVAGEEAGFPRQDGGKHYWIVRVAGYPYPAATPEAGADWATRALTRVPRPFDVVLLGMGEDGHTASLFPGSMAMARGLDATAAPACIAVNALASPHARVSLNLAALLDARRIVLHIEGDAKWHVYQRARQPGPASELPIRAVLHQREVPVDVYWTV